MAGTDSLSRRWPGGCSNLCRLYGSDGKETGAGLHPTGKAAELSEDGNEKSSDDDLSVDDAAFMRRPKMIWFNGILTLFVIGLLCFTKIPMYGAFMFGLAVALVANFHSAKDQARAIKMHAATALTMPMVLLASGVFLRQCAWA